jgi:hypothetical protein
MIFHSTNESGRWHLPADYEWTLLTDLLGESDIAGRKLKNIGSIQNANGF